ncbi:MAG: NADP-dependent isocitrate dehydrogenase, partial [Kiritimatiellia bacterium]
MNTSTPEILYTWTDEAPMLATCSLLPILQSFTKAAGINVSLKDISLAGRILAQFPEHLQEDQRIPDALSELGKIAKTQEANIVKLPNISASIPQLKAAILELQSQGYAVPDYQDEPKTDEENEIKSRYAQVLGSAVNPVLREGNSDRRVADPVKAYARTYPHSMGKWSADSKTRVASMDEGDFFGSEQSFVREMAGKVTIQLQTASGVQVLKKNLPLEAGEIFDGAVMSKQALCQFLSEQAAAAKREDVLLSLHMKATMMKVSDPIIFGHAVTVFFGEVLDKHAEALKEIGFDPDNGIGDLDKKITALSEAKQAEIKADLEAVYARQAELAMVDSDRGITNLHVPSDIIIDASMPAAIR